MHAHSQWRPLIQHTQDQPGQPACARARPTSLARHQPAARQVSTHGAAARRAAATRARWRGPSPRPAAGSRARGRRPPRPRPPPQSPRRAGWAARGRRHPARRRAERPVTLRGEQPEAEHRHGARRATRTSSHSACVSAQASMLLRSATLGVSTAGSTSACPDAGHVELPPASQRWMYRRSYLQARSLSLGDPARVARHQGRRRALPGVMPSPGPCTRGCRRRRAGVRAVCARLSGRQQDRVAQQLQ